MLAQDRVRIDGARNLRIGLVTDRTQNEAVEGPERFERSLRHRGAMRVEGAAADGHRPPVDVEALVGRGRLHDAHGRGDDLVTDVVAVEDPDGEVGHGAQNRSGASRRSMEASVSRSRTMATTSSILDLARPAKPA